MFNTFKIKIHMWSHVEKDSLGAFMVFNATFSYIVVISFIGGGTAASVTGNPPTSRTSLRNFIT